MEDSTHTHPAPPEDFLGREQELAYLTRAVSPRRPVVVCPAQGLEGVGCTALVRAFVARNTQAKLVLGWSIPLDGPRPHVALRRWAEQLGVDVTPLASLESLLDALVTPLADREHTLFVIDGVRVVDLAGVRGVLSLRTHTTSAVLTAEEAGVGALLGARELVLEPLLEDEAATLLLRAAGSGMPPIVSQSILQAVADLPLGIRLAAARLQTQRADESTGVWGARVDPERVQWLGGPTGVARAFLDLVRRLDADVLNAFRAVGALSFGRVSPEALAPYLGVDGRTAAAALDTLARHALLSRLGEGTFEIHPRLRRYAALLGEEEGSNEAWLRAALARVIRSGGVPGQSVQASEILDIVDTTLSRGSDDDIVALGARVGEKLSLWCEEAATTLLAKAVERAEATGHRSASRLRQRLAQVRARQQADEDGEIEIELDFEALGEPVEEVAESPLEPIEDAGEALAAYLRAERLGLDDDDPEAETSGRRPAPPLFDVGRMAAAARGESEGIEDARTRAAEAQASAEAAHARVIDWVGEGWRMSKGTDGRLAFEALVAGARRVATEARAVAVAVRAARSATEVGAASGHADRAEASLHNVLRAVAVAESGWNDLRSAAQDDDDQRTRAAVLRVQILADAEGARVAADDLIRRLKRHGEAGPEATLVRELTELGAQARDVEDRARRAEDDPETLSAEARLVLSAVLDRGRALTSGAHRSPVASDATRRTRLVADLRTSLERIERDVEWVSDLAAQLAAAGASDLVRQARSQRTRAVALVAEAEGAPAARWPGLREDMQEAVRAAGALHADAERLRAEQEADQIDTVDLPPAVELLALRSEAAARTAALESAAALARRASTRAGQSAAGLNTDVLSAETEALVAAEHVMRDALKEARDRLAQVGTGPALAAARSERKEAERFAREAEGSTRLVVEAAERLQSKADDERRDQLSALHLSRDALVSRANLELTLARESLEELEALIAQLESMGMPDPTEGALHEITERVELTAQATADGTSRLERTRDPAMGERVLAAMTSALEVAALTRAEAEAARDLARSAVEGAADGSLVRVKLTKVMDRARSHLAAAAVDAEALSAGASRGGRNLLAELHEDLALGRSWLDAIVLEAFEDHALAEIADDVHERVAAAERLVEQVRGRMQVLGEPTPTITTPTAAAAVPTPQERVAESLERARAAVGRLEPLAALPESSPSELRSVADAAAEAAKRARAALTALELVHLAASASSAGAILASAEARARTLATTCVQEVETAQRRTQEIARLVNDADLANDQASAQRLINLQARITETRVQLHGTDPDTVTADEVIASLLTDLERAQLQLTRLRAGGAPVSSVVDELETRIEELASAAIDAQTRREQRVAAPHHAPVSAESRVADDDLVDLSHLDLYDADPESLFDLPSLDRGAPPAPAVVVAPIDDEAVRREAAELEAFLSAMLAGEEPAAAPAAQAVVEEDDEDEFTEIARAPVAPAVEAEPSAEELALRAEVEALLRAEEDALLEAEAQEEARLAAEYQARIDAAAAEHQARIDAEAAALQAQVDAEAAALQARIDAEAAALQAELDAQAAEATALQTRLDAEAAEAAALEAEIAAQLAAEDERVEGEAERARAAEVEALHARAATVAAQVSALQVPLAPTLHAARAAVSALGREVPGTVHDDLVRALAGLQDAAADAEAHASLAAPELRSAADVDAVLRVWTGLLHGAQDVVRAATLARAAGTPVPTVKLPAPVPAASRPSVPATLPATVSVRTVEVAAPPLPTALAREALVALHAGRAELAVVLWREARSALRGEDALAETLVAATGARIFTAVGRPADAAVCRDRIDAALLPAELVAALDHLPSGPPSGWAAAMVASAREAAAARRQLQP